MPNKQVQANPAIRPLGPPTEQDIANIRDSFAQGHGVAETARRLGMSTNQISLAKKKHGLTSAPPPNAAQLTQASEAFASKARRERHTRRETLNRIGTRMLEDLERDLFTEEADVITLLRGMGGIETEERVRRVPARDLRERMAAINLNEVLIQKIDALEDDQGLSRGLSMLEKFAEAAATLAGGALPAPRDGLIQE